MPDDLPAQLTPQHQPALSAPSLPDNSHASSSKLYRLRRAVSFFFAALGVLVFLVTFTPLTSWWTRLLLGEWQNSTGDTLIVLAASSPDDGILPYDTYLRCEYAVRTYREGWVKRIIVSGGPDPHSTPASTQPPSPSVADAMRDFLSASGVPRDIIFTESASTSTRESALYLRALLGSLPGRPVLLTSDYHIYRARRVFANAGISVLVRPLPDTLKCSASLSGRWSAFLTLSQESTKIVYYLLRGWI